MQNIGIWHYFNPNDRGSYPVVRTRIQVKYANGVEDEGEWAEFFSQVKSLAESPITGCSTFKRLAFEIPNNDVAALSWKGRAKISRSRDGRLNDVIVFHAPIVLAPQPVL